MLNRVVLTGRLTRDPELRMSQSNIAVTSFNLAVNRSFTNKNGERGADFINCIAFKKQAENVQQYIRKGSLVGIDGRLQSRSYENKQGQMVYVTEVICDNVQFLEPRNQQEQGNQQQSNQYQQPQNNQYQQNSNQQSQYQQGQIAQPPNSAAHLQNQGQAPVDISDDDLPFDLGAQDAPAQR